MVQSIRFRYKGKVCGTATLKDDMHALRSGVASRLDMLNALKSSELEYRDFLVH